MKSLITLLLLGLIVASCSDSPSEVEVNPFEFQDISIENKIKQAVKHDYLKAMGLDDNSISYVQELYKNRSYKSKWSNDSTLSELGVRMKSVMQKNYSLGIPEGRIPYEDCENFVQDEIRLTITTSMVINDLKNGLIDYETKKSRPVNFTATTEYEEINFNADEDLRRQFIPFGPDDSTYSVLCNGLLQLVDNYPLDTTTFDIRSVKHDSTVSIEKTRVALISKGYLKKELKDSTSMAEALCQFQLDNGLKPDAVIGKYTSQSLNESTYHKMERIHLAMDKLRSDREYPKKFIRINIPEYRLRLYINDSLKSDHNIVVGKYENQTPELESKLRKIVVYPYWNVPYSISSKEILPSLKRNSNYLAKHNYKLYRNGEEVDPLTVDWKKIRQNAFPYKVVQDPGVTNSLGIIKFDFANKHSVYFHDTPSKGLFGADVRAYSHGCMRTQNPVDLARRIIERDSTRYKPNEIIVDSLDSMMSAAEHRIIKLLDPIPIYVDYVSVVSENQRMIVYLDIYGRDEEYLKIMRKEEL